MQNKKKCLTKQTQKHIKRVPLSNIPSFNCTEEIRIPTFSSTELKGIVRSIEMRKPPNSNPYKKNISRKSTCKSVKQNLNYQPPKLKTMMKQFKELKILHQNERSKSKSPVSCKSKSLQKLIPKKLSYKTLRTNPASEVNLAVKLERTIKKLNQTDFFREEDSMIQLKSSSDLASDRKCNQHLMTQQDQIININEVRQFCSTGTFLRHKDKNLAFKSYTSFKETMAAVKIQRAWRRFQTTKLVNNYIRFLHQQEDNAYLPKDILQSIKHFDIESEQENEIIENQAEAREELMIAPESFYKQKAQRCKIRHVSNLQEEVQSVSQDYEEIVKSLKAQQLEKWNQIISIISTSKTDNPQQLEKLLKRLAEQSQINKKQLQQKTRAINSISAKKKSFQSKQQEEQKIDVSQPVQEQRKEVDRKRFKNKSGSISSQALQEYDSKKYIEYLDGDFYVPQECSEISSQKNIEKAVKSSLISKRKQEILLQQLKITSIPIKLGQSALYKSESLKGLQATLKRQDIRSKSRESLKKSTSQKVLRKALLNIDQHSFDEYQEQINLDLLTRQFLEGSDPNNDNLDMVYSEQRLKNKLAELNRMKQNNQCNNDYQQQNINEEIFQSDPDDQPLQLQNSNTLKRSQPFKLPSQEHQIKIEEAEQSPKMKIETVQEEIRSDSVQQVDGDQENEKSETIASIIINNLILQVLKEISKSDTVSACFKSYCLSLKPRVRRAQGPKKKKGFATNKAQIENFIDTLLKYLKKQQPTVFRNLEIATGPSAIEMLKYMHQFGEQQSEGEQEEDEPNVMVIPNRMFDAFWQLKQKSIVIQVPQNYDQTNSVIFKHQFQVLKSFNKIFYRSLFDTFNQCLDHQRNFGLYGKPFPWKRTPVFHHKNTDQQTELHIQNAQRRMIELSTTYCGLIVEKEEMASISQEYIKQVHQDRLSRMLASDLIEAEQRWVFYDDEETQILVQIAGYIYTQILIQVIQEIYQFQ